MSISARLTERLLCALFVILVALPAFAAPPASLPVGAQTMAEDFAGGTWSSKWQPCPYTCASLGIRSIPGQHEAEAYSEPGFRGVILGDNAGNLIGPALDAAGNPTTLPFGRAGSPTNPKAGWIQFGPKPLGLNPFSASPDGHLRISATRTPASLLPYVWNLPWISGHLNTRGLWSQTYGYYEVTARVPAGQGAFPAPLWLMPASGARYAEGDVMEALGADCTVFYQSVHSAAGSTSHVVRAADVCGGYHTYGLWWAPDQLVWFFDGKETARQPTPADMNGPAYLLENLAVGGGSGKAQTWGGAYDASTPDPLTMDVAGVNVWAYVPGTVTPVGPIAGAPPPPPPPPPPATGQTTFSLTLSNGQVIDFTVNATAH